MTVKYIIHHVLGCDLDILFVWMYHRLLMTIDDRCDLSVMRTWGQLQVGDILRVVAAGLDTTEDDGDHPHT